MPSSTIYSSSLSPSSSSFGSRSLISRVVTYSSLLGLGLIGPLLSSLFLSLLLSPTNGDYHRGGGAGVVFVEAMGVKQSGSGFGGSSSGGGGGCCDDPPIGVIVIMAFGGFVFVCIMMFMLSNP